MVGSLVAWFVGVEHFPDENKPPIGFAKGGLVECGSDAGMSRADKRD
jgi:hypothetical protein